MYSFLSVPKAKCLTPVKETQAVLALTTPQSLVSGVNIYFLIVFLVSARFGISELQISTHGTDIACVLTFSD